MSKKERKTIDIEKVEKPELFFVNNLDHSWMTSATMAITPMIDEMIVTISPAMINIAANHPI